MSKQNKNTVIVMNENVFASIAKDIVTFGMFAGLLWFNHAYLSGSALVDAMFIIIVIIILTGRASGSVHKFYSNQEAINYLGGEALPYPGLKLKIEVEEAYKRGYTQGGLDTVADMRRTK